MQRNRFECERKRPARTRTRSRTHNNAPDADDSAKGTEARRHERSSPSSTLAALNNLEGRTPPWDLVVESCRTTMDKLEMPKTKPLDPQDRELILKVNALVHLGAIAEHERWDSCEAVARKFKSPQPPNARRCGYWHGVLTSKLEERGVIFNALLKHTQVPEDRLKARAAS